MNISTSPAESKDIPMDTSTRADHNGDSESVRDMTPGANPVGNQKDCE